LRVHDPRRSDTSAKPCQTRGTFWGWDLLQCSGSFFFPVVSATPPDAGRLPFCIFKDADSDALTAPGSLPALFLFRCPRDVSRRSRTTVVLHVGACGLRRSDRPEIPPDPFAFRRFCDVLERKTAAALHILHVSKKMRHVQFSDPSPLPPWNKILADPRRFYPSRKCLTFIDKKNTVEGLSSKNFVRVRGGNNGTGGVSFLSTRTKQKKPRSY
jgi:hypothetical protein